MDADTVKYRIDSGSWTTMPPTSGDEYSVDLSLTDDTLYLLSIRAGDAVGNMTGDTDKQVQVTVDAGVVNVISVSGSGTEIVIKFNGDMDVTEVTNDAYYSMDGGQGVDATSYSVGQDEVTLTLNADVSPGDILTISGASIHGDGISDTLGSGSIEYIIP